MPARARTTLPRYGLAIATSGAALLAALALRPHGGGYLSPLFLFYAAVAVSSWAGGFGPGLVATLLGTLAATYFLLSPHGHMAIERRDERGRLVLFVCVGVLIAYLNGRLRRNEAKAKALTRLEPHRRVLLRPGRQPGPRLLQRRIPEAHRPDRRRRSPPAASTGGT